MGESGALGVKSFAIRRPGRNHTPTCYTMREGKAPGSVVSEELPCVSSHFTQPYINQTLRKKTSRKLSLFRSSRQTGWEIFLWGPLWKTMVRPICESTSHVMARLEMAPLSTPCVNTVPALALHSRISMSCLQPCKKINSNTERVWSLSKVLFTCALFLIQTRLQFQMEYTGKKPY